MGYLCPSPHSRRVLRVGLISGACGLAFGAIAATALMSTPSPSATRAQSAATVGQATASGHADDAAAAVAPGVASAAQRPCSEQTWPYIDRTCINDAAPKPAPVRVLAPAAPTEGARGATQGATQEAALAGGDLKPADDLQPPAVSPPAREKTAQVRKKKRSHTRSRDDDSRSAYVSPNARYDYGMRNDYGTRYDYGARYPQQQRRETWSGGWSW